MCWSVGSGSSAGPVLCKFAPLLMLGAVRPHGQCEQQIEPSPERSIYSIAQLCAEVRAAIVTHLECHALLDPLAQAKQALMRADEHRLALLALDVGVAACRADDVGASQRMALGSVHHLQAGARRAATRTQATTALTARRPWLPLESCRCT